VLAAALAPLLGGAGPAVKASQPATHTIVIEAMRFEPGVVTVRAGDSVVWRNQDPFPHTATGTRFDSKSIAAGQSWTHRTTTVGEMPYLCTLHPTMKGGLARQVSVNPVANHISGSV
jgi:plastocyanin